MNSAERLNLQQVTLALVGFNVGDRVRLVCTDGMLLKYSSRWNEMNSLIGQEGVISELFGIGSNKWGFEFNMLLNQKNGIWDRLAVAPKNIELVL